MYQTEPGKIFRVTETAEGGLKVEVLENDTWVPGRVQLVGLRLAESTTTLDPTAIAALPA